MQVTLTSQGDIGAALAGLLAVVKDAADRATDRVGEGTRRIAGEQVRAALGQQASQTVGYQEYFDPQKPVAYWMHSRWWRGRKDVLEGFVEGSLITPTRAGALAVPMTSEAQAAGIPFAQGQVPTSFTLLKGQVAGMGEGYGRRRTTPGIFEQMTGYRLDEVKIGDRAYLVVHLKAPPQDGGPVRGRFHLNLRSLGYQKRRSTFTLFVFALLRQTRQPALIDVGPYVSYAAGALPAEFAKELSRLGPANASVAPAAVA